MCQNPIWVWFLLTLCYLTENNRFPETYIHLLPNSSPKQTFKQLVSYTAASAGCLCVWAGAVLQPPGICNRLTAQSGARRKVGSKSTKKTLPYRSEEDWMKNNSAAAVMWKQHPPGRAHRLSNFMQICRASKPWKGAKRTRVKLNIMKHCQRLNIWTHHSVESILLRHMTLTPHFTSAAQFQHDCLRKAARPHLKNYLLTLLSHHINREHTTLIIVFTFDPVSVTDLLICEWSNINRGRNVHLQTVSVMPFMQFETGISASLCQSIGKAEVWHDNFSTLI